MVSDALTVNGTIDSGAITSTGASSFGTGQFDNIGVGTAPEAKKGIFNAVTSGDTGSTGIRNESINTLGTAGPGTILGLSFIHSWIPSEIVIGFGSRNVNLLAGAHGGPAVDTSGADSIKDAKVLEMTGFLSAFGNIIGGGLHTGTLTITEAIGFHAFDIPSLTDATITTQYGIKIDNQTRGDTNWAIFSAGGNWILNANNQKLLFGAASAGNASITYDGTNLIIDSAVVGTGDLVINDNFRIDSIGRVFFGENQEESIYSDGTNLNINFDNPSIEASLILHGNLVLPKASGNGIKIDTAAPTFGWRDLLGETTTRSTGANKPSFETYNGEINQYRFSAGEHEHYDFHIPHDYVAGTDIHLHIHWSQISTTNTGGTVDFKYSAVYSKGHNQAAFTGTPITDTFTSADAGIIQYQQHITEIIISGASATVALFDRDDLEPDGLILLTLEMNANNLTDDVSVTDPFIHFADLHYRSTNISTKDKVPNFYS